MKNVLLSSLVILAMVGLVFGNIGLFIIDVQNCFMDTTFNPTASLPVTGGSGVIPVINWIRGNYSNLFSIVIRSQDWHCPHHISFASSYQGWAPYDDVILTYSNESGSPQLCDNVTGWNNTVFPNNIDNEVNCTTITWSIPQTLWPNHCIINSTDAQFAPGQTTASTDIIVQKGYKCWVDSYSALYDNGHFTSTTLPGILAANPITTAVVLGLAFDYCVFYTSMDLKAAGIDTYVIVDGTRYIDPSTNMTATTTMLAAGIHLINYAQLCQYINCSASNSSSSSSSSGSLGFSIVPSSLLLIAITFIATLLLKN